MTGSGTRGNADVDRATRWFDRYRAAAVFLGRLLAVVRTFISLPAGFANMAPVRFGVHTLAGRVPWTPRPGPPPRYALPIRRDR